MIFAAVPYAIAQAGLGNPTFGGFSLIGLSIATPITVAATIITLKSEKDSFQRGFAIWSATTHGIFASVFVALFLQQL